MNFIFCCPPLSAAATSAADADPSLDNAETEYAEDPPLELELELERCTPPPPPPPPPIPIPMPPTEGFPVRPCPCAPAR